MSHIKMDTKNDRKQVPTWNFWETMYSNKYLDTLIHLYHIFWANNKAIISTDGRLILNAVIVEYN